MKENTALYGHIFKLPPGDYVIGGEDNKTANIYYLAVQGQTEGNVGVTEVAGIGNTITDVDFLTVKPDYDVRTIEAWEFAGFSFRCNFNTVNGEFTVGCNADDRNKLRISFSDYPRPYVTYLFLYSQTTNLEYYVTIKFGVGNDEATTTRYTVTTITIRSN